MSTPQLPDEPLKLLEDDAEDKSNRPPWFVVLVDDEPDVHAATSHALREVEILDRPLKFISAYSEQEGAAILATYGAQVAVAMIDVVMENDHAGLDLVHHMRVKLGNTTTRVILRTGQPGYAPEQQVMRQYDINDYRTKSELSFDRLVTTLTGAIRSYQQIVTLENSRRGLNLIVNASSELSKRHGLISFAQGVIQQIAALLGLPPDGLLCVRGAQRPKESPEDEPSPHEPWVVAAAGNLARWTSQPLSKLEPAELASIIGECLARQESSVLPGCTCLYFRDDAARDFAVYLDTPEQLSPLDQQLLQVFSTNISTGFDNVSLIERLETYAFVDASTNLPNRTRFLQLLDNARTAGQAIAMALLDIQGFSGINSAIGYPLGNELLRAIGERLSRALGSDTVVARVAGDVFAVCGSPSAIQPSALEKVFAENFVLGSVALLVRASAGLVAAQHIGYSAQEALKRADIALHQAKSQPGGGYIWFEPAMEAAASNRLQMLQQLRQVTQSGGLKIYYQPQVDLASGRPIGVEALLRWQRPDGSFVPPDHFIPLVEASGDIVSLGNWVLRSACRQLAQWSAQGQESLRLAVNVSLVQFRTRDFVGQVAAALRESGVAPNRLELEITEAVAMGGFDQIGPWLGELRAIGVRVAIDDFGTGFSSLSYLQELAIDRLKVDRGFVANLPPEHTRQAIARSIIRLAQDIGIPALAVGVETQAQAEYLRHLGCQEAQGFLYAPALPEQELLRWLQEREAQCKV
jgi:diguanylate cyclase (GGDEF)-like protein